MLDGVVGTDSRGGDSDGADTKVHTASRREVRNSDVLSSDLSTWVLTLVDGCRRPWSEETRVVGVEVT